MDVKKYFVLVLLAIATVVGILITYFLFFDAQDPDSLHPRVVHLSGGWDVRLYINDGSNVFIRNGGNGVFLIEGDCNIFPVPGVQTPLYSCGKHNQISFAFGTYDNANSKQELTLYTKYKVVRIGSR